MSFFKAEGRARPKELAFNLVGSFNDWDAPRLSENKMKGGELDQFLVESHLR